jgi:tetratricopeptide (TPR) repeat protein
MYRVNELFTRKHFLRWFFITIVIYSIIYVAVWKKFPPPQMYKRYSVGLIQSNTSGNWFGEYVTDLITKCIKPYVSEKEYLFPYQWIYRITPSDSALSPTFNRQIFQKLPIHRVLVGNVNKKGKKVKAFLQVLEFPSGKSLKMAETDFFMYNQRKFLDWLTREFGRFLPFHDQNKFPQFYNADSLLQLSKRQFFCKNYQAGLHLLDSRKDEVDTNSELNLWHQYAEIKLAGLGRLGAEPKNPYGKRLPEWQKKLKLVRNGLVDFLRAGHQDLMTKVLVAESFIWEEDFSAAEIFLEEAYVENPFDIDVLLNLSFLHASRYKEFGFSGIQAIYEQILAICPIEEQILLQWSDTILLSNPPQTAPPKSARERITKYLEINPHSYKVWLMLGKIFAQALHKEQALKSFFKADSIQPNSGVIHYNIGAFYYEWREPAKAKDHIIRAIEYDDYLNAYLYLGAILKDQGKYEEALEKFRYRVTHKQGKDDYYAYQAMKGIQECLQALGQKQE